MEEPTTLVNIIEAIGAAGTFALAVIYLFVKYALPALKGKASPEASASVEVSQPKPADDRTLQTLEVLRDEVRASREEVRGDYREIADKVDKIADRAERIERLALILDERTKK